MPVDKNEDQLWNEIHFETNEYTYFTFVVTINLAHLEMSGQTFIDMVGMPIVHIPSLYVVGMPIVHIPSLYVNIIIIIHPCPQLNVDLDKLPL